RDRCCPDDVAARGLLKSVDVRRRFSVAARALAGVALIGAAAPCRAAQTVASCAARKNACVSRRVAASLACIIKATKKALAADAECLAKADARFGGGAG